MTSVLIVAAVLSITAQSITSGVSGLAGRWEREGAPQTMPDYTEPEWQEITIDTETVRVVRATRPALVETYRTDGIERQANRVAPENRRCRAGRDSSKAVMECLDPRDRGWPSG